jgi:hypothetical protein
VVVVVMMMMMIMMMMTTMMKGSAMDANVVKMITWNKGSSAGRDHEQSGRGE